MQSALDGLGLGFMPAQHETKKMIDLFMTLQTLSNKLMFLTRRHLWDTEGHIVIYPLREAIK